MPSGNPQSKNRIDVLFEKARGEGRCALMPFLTAGDPDLPTTVEVAASLVAAAEEAGVPLLLEIGFPYSDPIADGPTIQASYTRALDRGLRIAELFDAVAGLRRRTETPLIAMASYSLVYKGRPDDFIRRAQEAGFDGAIIPDLPVEEAAEVFAIGRERNISIIQLIAPTTPAERAAEIARTSTGFIYFVSVTGITGERDELPAELVTRVSDIRRLTELPICIGFGISKPAHIEQLRGIADGVIVGSAIVRRVQELVPGDAAGVANVTDFVSGLLAPLRKGQ